MQKIRFICLLCLISNLCLAQKHYLDCQNFKQTQAETLQSIAAKTTAMADAREDSFGITHYDISLDVTDFENRIIAGNCKILMFTKVNDIQRIELDLESLLVEKVEINGEPATFTQQSPKLYIDLKGSFAAGQFLEVNVFYAGKPQSVSFGGFYFSSNYAYNLGVGIGVDPPNYGRAWFPCFDTFSSRSIYDFHITTIESHKAFCNGLLEGFDTNENGTKTWHWKLYQSIPTYLASVAVADYETLESVHVGAYDPILIQLAARAADTTNLKISFEHLPNAIDAFEAAYGKHRFDKVGFSIVPFGGGAMEHATNIAYPTFAIDGTLVFEDLMAHEFGHHWWGDLVTCETADDMWLNEGWASFGEHLFMEAVYGKEAYLSSVVANHIEVMQYAHIRDGGHYPVSGVPFDITYGSHVYSKGADVAHTLRGYMGDEAFFRCIREYLSAFAFKTATSEQFRDFLAECSGFDLDDFFNDWVFNAGFPHFAIDSIVVGFDGNPFTADVYIRQKLYAAPDFFEQVPMDITFYDTNMNMQTEKIWLNGECDIHSFDLPFYPVMTVLDIDQKISDAVTENQQMISTTGVYDFENAKMQVTVNQIADSTLLRIEHHWAAPDRMKNAPEGLVFSPNRYWKVDGIRYNLFLASATIAYNGAATLNGGYLDNDLMGGGSESALQVYYRASPANEWQKVTGVSQDTQGNSNDRRGSFTINNLQFGEYTLAFFDNNRTDPIVTSNPTCMFTDIEDKSPRPKAESFLTIHPNPFHDKFTVSLKDEYFNAGKLDFRVYSTFGKLMLEKLSSTSVFELDMSHLPVGVYYYWAKLENGKVMSGKVVRE
ncbi:MAG: M1 family aminopeptidase [Chitinophagales bacterium]